MRYISVKEASERWGISERMVRNYCASGRIDGAFITGKTWNIPETANKPMRSRGKGILETLRAERSSGISGGLYHIVQVELTYNSNRIEGSRLDRDITRMIFETNTVIGESLNADDVVTAANHFRCVDMIIDDARRRLTEPFLKELHRTLMNGTSASRIPWFSVGDYKKVDNTVGGIDTAPSEDVPDLIRQLISEYESKQSVTMGDIIEFHWRFESIHPFQDGNGRVGRLIMFKECLRHGIVPFIITDEMKAFYYNGLRDWPSDPAYLTDTCLAAQDRFKVWLDRFRIRY